MKQFVWAVDDRGAPRAIRLDRIEAVIAVRITETPTYTNWALDCSDKGWRFHLDPTEYPPTLEGLAKIDALLNPEDT